MPGVERLNFSLNIYRSPTRSDSELLPADHLVTSKAALSPYKLARPIAVAIIGSTILAVGILMLVLPGPAIVLIPVGLAILSIEFAWARLWLKRVRERMSARNAENLGVRVERHRDRVR